jgi:hypothetical protein
MVITIYNQLQLLQYHYKKSYVHNWLEFQYNSVVNMLYLHSNHFLVLNQMNSLIHSQHHSGQTFSLPNDHCQVKYLK